MSKPPPIIDKSSEEQAFIEMNSGDDPDVGLELIVIPDPPPAPNNFNKSNSVFDK